MKIRIEILIFAFQCLEQNEYFRSAEESNCDRFFLLEDAKTLVDFGDPNLFEQIEKVTTRRNVFSMKSDSFLPNAATYRKKKVLKIERNFGIFFRRNFSVECRKLIEVFVENQAKRREQSERLENLKNLIFSSWKNFDFGKIFRSEIREIEKLKTIPEEIRRNFVASRAVDRREKLSDFGSTEKFSNFLTEIFLRKIVKISGRSKIAENFLLNLEKFSSIDDLRKISTENFSFDATRDIADFLDFIFLFQRKKNEKNLSIVVLLAETRRKLGSLRRVDLDKYFHFIPSSSRWFVSSREVKPVENAQVFIRD